MSTPDTREWQGPYVIWRPEGPIFTGEGWFERASAAKPDDCEWTIDAHGYVTWKPKAQPKTYVAE